MPKEQANFRLDSEAKAKAYAVLAQIGINPTDAVNMFIHHIAMFGELPFKPRIPNAQTLEALQEAKDGKTNTFESVDDMFDELDLR